MCTPTKPIPTALPGGIDGAEPKEATSAAALHADLPMLGIEFKQFSHARFYKFVALFKGKSPNDSHVYEVTVRPWPDGTGNIRDWHANCTTDGGTVFTLTSKSKWTAIQSGLAAMRAHLIRSHKAAWRTWRASEKSGTSGTSGTSGKSATEAE